MAPETGAMDPISESWGSSSDRACAQNPLFSGSETETGEVAVADGNTAAGGQQAVDGGHQTAEQGAGGQEADGCSFGHVCPLFLGRGTIPLRDLRIIYVYQMPAT